MIKKTAYIESAGVNPHRNLAVEEYLFSKCGEDEAILYLWQNENTIVIGKNQNAWRECRISRIEEDGAVIARRISGGGAVFRFGLSAEPVGLPAEPHQRTEGFP